MSVLKDKNVVVGISGGIAAYKVPEFIRQLVKEQASVKVVTSNNALQFVTKTTLQTLSNNNVYSNIFDSYSDFSVQHVSLRQWADILIVAPATANCIAKIANGIADDALSTTILAMCPNNQNRELAIPIVIAPAMNEHMYFATPLQNNLKILTQFSNVTLLDCAEGPLACHTSGKGRMQETDVLLHTLRYTLSPKPLKNRRVLITMGATREYIDPVRFISNESSGKMGYHIANQCAYLGADVDIVSAYTTTSPPFLPQDVLFNAKQRTILHKVVTAQQMFEVTSRLFPQADIVILCAAVSDFTPNTTEQQKIKSKDHPISLSLNPTTDIAKTLGAMKRDNQIVMGFALETENELANAKGKLSAKNLDAIVLNSLNEPGAGFNTDTNKITIISRLDRTSDYPLLAKEQTAINIVNYIIENFII